MVATRHYELVVVQVALRIEELYKVDNPEDLTIMDIYGVNEKGEPSTKAGLIGAETLRMKMLEREHNLWSY